MSEVGNIYKGASVYIDGGRDGVGGGGGWSGTVGSGKISVDCEMIRWRGYGIVNPHYFVVHAG